MSIDVGQLRMALGNIGANTQVKVVSSKQTENDKWQTQDSHYDVLAVIHEFETNTLVIVIKE